MENEKLTKFHYSYQVGMIFTIIGAIAIYLQIVMDLIFTLTHTIFDVVPAPTYLNSTQTLLYILILAIGIPSFLLFVLVTKFFIRKSQKRLGMLAFLLFIIASLGFNASLMFGAGWYAGLIIGDLGLCALLNAIIHHHRNDALMLENLTDLTKKLGLSHLSVQ